MTLRRTRSTQAVARALLEDPSDLGGHYCTDICRRTGLKAGTVSPILSIRFAQNGWVTVVGTGKSPLGGPPRVYLKVTEVGHREIPVYLKTRTEEES